MHPAAACGIGHARRERVAAGRCDVDRIIQPLAVARPAHGIAAAGIAAGREVYVRGSIDASLVTAAMVKIRDAVAASIEVLGLNRPGNRPDRPAVRTGSRRRDASLACKNPRVVVYGSRGRRKIGLRAQNDLIDLDAVLARLDPNRLRASGRELEERVLRLPPGIVRPPPARHPAVLARLAIHENRARRADPVLSAAAGPHRVRELDPHRIVPLRVAGRPYPQPQPVGLPRLSGEARLEVVGWSGHR